MSTITKPLSIKLGQTTQELRVTSMTHTCRICGEAITPQMCWAHFETFKSHPYTDFLTHKVVPSTIMWRVCGWSHIHCEDVAPKCNCTPPKTMKWSKEDNCWICDECEATAH